MFKPTKRYPVEDDKKDFQEYYIREVDPAFEKEGFFIWTTGWFTTDYRLIVSLDKILFGELFDKLESEYQRSVLRKKKMNAIMKINCYWHFINANNISDVILFLKNMDVDKDFVKVISKRGSLFIDECIAHNHEFTLAHGNSKMEIERYDGWTWSIADEDTDRLNKKFDFMGVVDLKKYARKHKLKKLNHNPNLS